MRGDENKNQLNPCDVCVVLGDYTTQLYWDYLGTIYLVDLNKKKGALVVSCDSMACHQGLLGERCSYMYLARPQGDASHGPCTKNTRWWHSRESEGIAWKLLGVFG